MWTTRRLGWIVFLAAAAVRLAFVLPMPADTYRSAFSSDNTLDSKGYVDVAHALIEHHVFGYGERASAYRPPVYPALLAGIFTVVGDNYRVVRILQALLGGGAALALFGIGTLLFDRRVGLAAGLMLAAYPFAIYFAGTIMTEPVFIALAMTAFFLALLTVEAPTNLRIVLAGLVAGVTALCRPTFVPYIGIAAAVGLAAMIGWAPRRFRPLLAGGLIAIAVMTPWIVRNSLLFGRPTFITTYAGLNLYHGLPGKDHISELQDFGYNYHMIEDPHLATLPKSEREAEAEHKAYWSRFVREHPADYAREKLRNAVGFWFDFNLAGNLGKRPGIVALGSFGAYLAILVLGVAGTVLLIRRKRWYPLAVTWTIILLTFLPTMQFFAGKRYRAPTVDPILMLLAALLLVELGWRFVPRRWAERIAS